LKAKYMLQYMKSVHVQLYPWYGNDATARAFYAMVKNPKATDEFDNCSVKMTLLKKFEPARVDIVWEDQTEQKFEVENLPLPKLLEDISRKRQSLALLELMRGIKAEFEPEPDPFEEHRLELEKKNLEKKRKQEAEAQRRLMNANRKPQL